MKQSLLAAMAAVVLVASMAAAVRAQDPTPISSTQTPTGVAPTQTPTAVAPTQTATAVASTPTPTGVAGAFVVRIPASTLDQDQRPFFEQGMHTPALRFQQISAWVGQQRCTTVNLSRGRAPNGDAVLVLGTGNQPSDCGKEGAIVRFTVTDKDRPLFATFPLKRGISVDLTNLLPPAPQTGDGGLVGNDGPAQADSVKPPGRSEQAGWPLLVGAVVLGMAGALLLPRYLLVRREAHNQSVVIVRRGWD